MAALVTSVGWLRHKLKHKLVTLPQRGFLAQNPGISHGGRAKAPILETALLSQQPNHCLLQKGNHLTAFPGSYIS